MGKQKNEIDERGVRALVEIYVKFHKEEEKDPSLGDEARALVQGNRERQFRST